MSECWQSGDLRAWIDRELAPEDAERVAAHLAGCAVCRERRREIAARAARVAVWMDDLGEIPPVAPAPRPVRRLRKWALAGLAAAAGITVAIVAIPRDRPSPASPAAEIIQPPPAAVRQVEADPIVPEPVPAVRTAAVTRTAPRGRRPKPPQAAKFIALDNEPFETGLVVRVALGPDEIPADVIFSPDGRPRAYRLVYENRSGR